MNVEGWVMSKFEHIIVESRGAIGIITLNSAYRTDLAARITALSIGTLPLIAVYLACSKTFIRGLTMGAIKG
jgi:multiple sugar transport system permease protein/cellobiose transport system permease protein